MNDMRSRAFFVLAATGFASLLPRVARAEIIEITPEDDLVAALDALSPGDELVLGGGTYSVDARLSVSVSGTEAAPIVIRSKEGEVAIITRPDASQNTINIENVSYVELRGLEIVGGSRRRG